MHGSGIQNHIVILFGAAVFIACLFRMIRVPSIIGFLLAGIGIGPHAWQWVSTEDVDRFAGLGLILLLFTIGIELSPQSLVRSGKRLALATLVQVSVTAGLTALCLLVFAHSDLKAALVLGIAVSLSSTAIVLKQISDRGETGSTTGLIATGILLLQDILVIAIMLAMSLAGPASGQSAGNAMLLEIAKLAGAVVFILLAKRCLPPILALVSRYGGRELLTLFAMLMACGGASLASLAGWSPALGACIAGLLLAGADQRHQLVAEITPFRDIFNAIFFVSLGMMVNLQVLAHHFLAISAAIAATLLLKPAITMLAIRLMGWPVRIGFQVGIGLCTVSEFSYILAYEAQAANLLPPGILDVVIAYTVGTMTIGALLYPAARPLANALSNRFPAPKEKEPLNEEEKPHYENHVIVIGYGFTGSSLARMLKATHVPFCVVEMNHALLKQAKEDGCDTVAGDATRMTILEHAGLSAARAAVVAINDTQATRRIVAQLGALRPELYILARTNFVRDIDALYALGAKVVIPQDFETSIEVAAHILKQFGLPDNIVEAQLASVRSGGYGMLRGKPLERAANAELIKVLESTTTQTYFIEENTPVCGQTIAQTNLRALSGCMIIAVVRNGAPQTNPPGDLTLQANDTLVLVGAHHEIEAAKTLLNPKHK